MEISVAVQWITFLVFAFIALAGALGMTTTMSMFRSGIFLMASFIGVAGLFILLLADLLGLLQIMMYIGGMLVMILFMLLFSSDPGGAMMSTHMQLKGFEKFFSLGLSRKQGPASSQEERGHSKRADLRAHRDGGGEHRDGEDDGHEHEGHQQHGGQGGHSGMSMFTEVKAPAAMLALVTGVFLCFCILWRPAWPVVDRVPVQDSPQQIGQLLMGKYMIAFEGAGMLILLGIFGAVFTARPGSFPGSRRRDRIQAASDEDPPGIEDAPLEPLYRTDLWHDRREPEADGSAGRNS